MKYRFTFGSLLLLVVVGLLTHGVSAQECAADSADGECVAPVQIPDTTCRFYMAESRIYKGKLGLFSAVDFAVGDVLHEDLWIPLPNNQIETSIFDKNGNTDWHSILLKREDVQERLRLETEFDVKSFVGGIGATAKCHASWANIHPIVPKPPLVEDRSSLERRVLAYQATNAIRAGQELVTICDDDEEPTNAVPAMSSDVWHLKHKGVCVDRLFVENNSKNAAYSKHDVKKGQVVATSPVVLLDRSQMDIVQQSWNDTSGSIDFSPEDVYGQLELLNFCLGHSNSSTLVLPYGPQVNQITFADDNKPANVQVAWRDSKTIKKYLNRTESALDLPKPIQAMMHAGKVMIDYIALEDIKMGDEIVLEYGHEWRLAWKQHQQRSTQNQVSVEDYLRTQYISKNPAITFRTTIDQFKEPYPKTMETACWYQEEHEPTMDIDKMHLVWNPDTNGKHCLRPCTVVNREFDEVTNADVYTVRVHPIPNPLAPPSCKLTEKTRSHFVFEVPADAITVVNRPSDYWKAASTVFRRERGVPDNGFYPKEWYASTA